MSLIAYCCGIIIGWFFGFKRGKKLGYYEGEAKEANRKYRRILREQQDKK